MKSKCFFMAHFSYLSYKGTLTVFRSKPFDKFDTSPFLMLTARSGADNSASQQRRARGRKPRRARRTGARSTEPSSRRRPLSAITQPAQPACPTLLREGDSSDQGNRHSVATSATVKSQCATTQVPKLKAHSDVHKSYLLDTSMRTVLQQHG